MIGSEITVEEIRGIALRGDPILAYWLWRSDPKHWIVLSQRVTFPGGVIGDTLTANLPEGFVGCPTYVRDITFEVERPNYLLGDARKEVFDEANARRPGVDVSIKITGCTRFTIEDDLVPIQVQARPATVAETAGCCKRFTLTPLQSVKATFVLTRNLREGENPYRVILAYRGIALTCGSFLDVPVDRCVSELKVAGILEESYHYAEIPEPQRHFLRGRG